MNRIGLTHISHHANMKDEESKDTNSIEDVKFTHGIKS